MRYTALTHQMRAARRRLPLSQAALAARSGVSRVTIARVETGALQDCRVGTLSRLLEALDLELATVSRTAAPAAEMLLARERERSRRLDRRRQHATLAARLLILSRPEARSLLRRARQRVDLWQRERLCSHHYITRWRALLAGPLPDVARGLLDPGPWADALFQNSPWTFAFEAKAP